MRVVLPKRLAVFNRRFTNRVTGPLLRWLPGFGVVVHTGRRSGRHYRTPVNVFTTRRGYVVALTYGADSDWVKNVLAAGGCHLERLGRRHDVTAGPVVHDRHCRDVPAIVRPILRLLGVADFLTLTPKPGRTD